LFGKIIDGAMIENEYGAIVRLCWNTISEHYPHVQCNDFIIMPNHVHGIIVIHDNPRRGAVIAPQSSNPGYNVVVASKSSRPNVTTPKQFSSALNLESGRDNRAPTVGNMVAFFKYKSTTQINNMRNSGICKIWQRNYYDHIIRNDRSLYLIRKYIAENPGKWAGDFENHLLVEEQAVDEILTD
jgi:putative transposase